jgi:hypothetical protein
VKEMLFAMSDVTSLGEQEPHSICLCVWCWKVGATTSTCYSDKWTHTSVRHSDKVQEISTSSKILEMVV